VDFDENEGHDDAAASGGRIRGGILAPGGGGGGGGGNDDGARAASGYDSDESTSSSCSGVNTTVLNMDRYGTWDKKWDVVMSAINELSRRILVVQQERGKWSDYQFDTLESNLTASTRGNMRSMERELEQMAQHAERDKTVQRKLEALEKNEQVLHGRIRSVLKHVLGTALKDKDSSELTQVSEKVFTLPKGLTGSTDPVKGHKLGQALRTLLHGYTSRTSHMIYPLERIIKDVGWRMGATSTIKDDTSHPLHQYEYYAEIYTQQVANLFALLQQRDHNAVMKCMTELRTPKVGEKGWEVSRGEVDDGMSLFMRWHHQLFQHSKPERKRFETALRTLPSRSARRYGLQHHQGVG